MLNNYALLRHLSALTTLTCEERLVAMDLALHRNASTLRCDPTQETLSRRLGIPQQRLSRVLSRLRRAGVIESILVPDYQTGYRHHTQYYFLHDWDAALHGASGPDYQGTDLDRENLECVRLKVTHRASLQPKNSGKCVQTDKECLHAFLGENHA